MLGGDRARFAFEPVAEKHAFVARAPAPLLGCAERIGRPRHQPEFGAGEDRVARLGRFVGGIGERARAPTSGRSSCVALRRSARASASVVGSGTVGPEPITAGSSPGTSEIAERHDARRMRAARQPAAFDAREMLAHGVDLADGGARAQQRARDRLLLGERQAVGRRDPVRRGAARNQHQHEIVGAGAVGERERAFGGIEAGLVRHRMAGFDHLDHAGRPAIAVPRDRDAGEAVGRKAAGVEIVPLRRPRSSSRRLCRRRARSAAHAGRCRKMWGEAARRMRRRDCFAEQLFQEDADRRNHVAEFLRQGPLAVTR